MGCKLEASEAYVRELATGNEVFGNCNSSVPVDVGIGKGSLRVWLIG